MKIYYWARDYSMRSLTKSHSRNTVFRSDIFVPNNYSIVTQTDGAAKIGNI